MENFSNQFTMNFMKIVIGLFRKQKKMFLSNTHRSKTKGSCDATELMQNPVAIRKWLLAEPEQVRLKQFLKSKEESKDNDNFCHDEGYSTTTFKSQVISLVEAFLRINLKTVQHGHGNCRDTVCMLGKE